MDESQACLVCSMTDILETADGHECATCGHEWAAAPNDADEQVVKDSNSNVLKDGDTVTVIKDLKVKGSTVTLKAGTKIKGIRVVAGDHDVDCKVDGMGVMLKAKFLKKA